MSERANPIEAYEDALIALLASRLPPDVRIAAQPDDAATADLAGSNAHVLVHHAGSQSDGANRAGLAGTTEFAVICLSRSLRGPGGAYALVTSVEQALAGEAIAGGTEIAHVRTALQSQTEGWWRYVVQIRTRLMRGMPRAPAGPFLSSFEVSP